jgi:chitodextrinase
MKALCLKFSYLMICTLLLLSLFITAKTFAANTYYVSPTGNDSGSGSSIAPFKSIQKAANIVNPGDTVIVMDGDYIDNISAGEVVNIWRSGTSTGWITFKSANKWGAKIDCQNNTTSYGWNIGAISYVNIENFEIFGCTWGGIWSNMSAHDVYIYSNKIHDIGRWDGCPNYMYGRPGIFQGLGTSHHTYDSNIFYSIGRYPQGTPDPSDECVQHFYQHDQGIYTRGLGYNTVMNNVFYDLQAGFAVAVGTDSPPNMNTNMIIVNNTIDMYNPGLPGDIVTDAGVQNLLVQNNIFFNPNSHAIYSSCEWGQDTGWANNQLKNNLVYPNIPWFSPSSQCVNFRGSFTETGTVLNQNPDFVDEVNRNYHLTSGSPAIYAGLTFSDRTYDADGNSIAGTPDIGSYEYVVLPADTTAPSTPTGLAAAVVSSTQINLSWSASTDNVGVTGYKIYRNGTQITTTTGTSYASTGLSSSTVYTYTISAYDAAGNASPQSGPVSVTTLSTTADTTTPSTPSDLKASVVSSTQINLSWTASTDNVGVAGYKIYRNGTQIATTTGTSYANTGLFPSTTYTYTVSAYDAAGNNSSQSSSVSVRTVRTVKDPVRK